MDSGCADTLLRTSQGSIETHDESGAPKLYVISRVIFNAIIGPQNILSLYTTVSLHKNNICNFMVIYSKLIWQFYLCKLQKFLRYPQITNIVT